MLRISWRHVAFAALALCGSLQQAQAAEPPASPAQAAPTGESPPEFPPPTTPLGGSGAFPPPATPPAGSEAFPPPTRPLGGKQPGEICTEQDRTDALLKLQEQLIKADESTGEGHARGDRIRREIERMKSMKMGECVHTDLLTGPAPVERPPGWENSRLTGLTPLDAKLDQAEKKLSDEIAKCLPISIEEYESLADEAARELHAARIVAKTGTPINSEQLASNVRRSLALIKRAHEAVEARKCPPPPKTEKPTPPKIDLVKDLGLTPQESPPNQPPPQAAKDAGQGNAPTTVEQPPLPPAETVHQPGGDKEAPKSTSGAEQAGGEQARDYPSEWPGESFYRLNVDSVRNEIAKYGERAPLRYEIESLDYWYPKLKKYVEESEKGDFGYRVEEFKADMKLIETLYSDPALHYPLLQIYSESGIQIPDLYWHPSKTQEPTDKATGKSCDTPGAAGACTEPATIGETGGATETPVNPQIQQVYAMINEERAEAGLSPLKRNPALEQSAQVHANEMGAAHQLEHATREGRGAERETIGQGLPTETLLQIAERWTAEKKYFRSGMYPNVCFGLNGMSLAWSVCAHYTQMIWAITTEVGCAAARASGFIWLDCRFLPGGNKDDRPVGMASEALVREFSDYLKQHPSIRAADRQNYFDAYARQGAKTAPDPFSSTWTAADSIKLRKSLAGLFDEPASSATNALNLSTPAPEILWLSLASAAQENADDPWGLAVTYRPVPHLLPLGESQPLPGRAIDLPFGSSQGDVDTTVEPPVIAPANPFQLIYPPDEWVPM